MKNSTITLSAIIGISLLSLGVLGISRADASALAQDDWSKLSSEGRENRLEHWKMEHQRRTQVMEKLLAYLDLDEDSLKELYQTEASLLSYIEENGYDLETVKELFREGMVAQLEERLAEGEITEIEYQQRFESIDARIARSLNRVGRGQDGPRPEGYDLRHDLRERK